MTSFAGLEFKKSNRGPWFKWLRKDMTHNDFTYNLGLNIDPIKFDTTRNCVPGGLHLINGLRYLPEFYSYGPVLGIFDIPDEAQVYISDTEKFKCDRVILLETITSEKILLSLFKESVRQGCSMNEDICLTAFEHDHFEILEWMRHISGCDLNEEAYNKAVKKGDLEGLKWLRKKGFPWDYEACTQAAMIGHLEILEWLLENGCPRDEDACAFAAMNGQLETLKCLRKNKCPWDTRTCTYAAEYGHLEVLKWARSNGCPWDYHTYQIALFNDQKEVLKWIMKKGCPQKKTCQELSSRPPWKM